MQRIGVGIIGLSAKGGWAATAHVPALERLPEYEIRGLSASSQSSAKAAAEKFHVPLFFDNPGDLVSHPKIDLVVVAVKVMNHREIIHAALPTGKMVYSEWPLGRDLKEAIELAALAKSHGNRTVIGLQSRAVPAVNYVRDLLRDGYVGEVLSVSLIGSGILWGATLRAASVYTLAPENGAGMINVSFAHGLDSVCYMLDSRIGEVTAVLANRRTFTEIVETKEKIPMVVPDQILVSAKLENEIVASCHYRGGLSRATNFRCEINGTRGDLVLEGSLGYPGVGDAKIWGGNSGDQHTRPLPVPEKYLSENAPNGPARALFYTYARLANNLKTGSPFSGTFDDAVLLHRAVDAIERSAKESSRIQIP